MSSMSPFEEDEELEGVEFASTSIENLSQDQIDEEARTQDIATYVEYQRIVLPEGATRADAILELSKQIPENSYALPAFFYRSDLLPYGEQLGNLTQADADAALVDLNYDEGYPTYNGGMIFWQQLPHEPVEDFFLFQRYLDQAEDIGLRQIHMLAHDQSMPMLKVQTLYHEYFWKARARAYDLFQVAAQRKLRDRRARRIEDDHFKIADQQLSALKDKLDNPEIYNNLSGKEILECLRLLINIQRVSNGLPQNGNAGFTPFNPDAAMDSKQLMEAITKDVSTTSSEVGLGDGLLSLMKDPTFALMAQGLVLRVRQADDANSSKDVTIDPSFQGQ